jgi:FtsP/CotA-like multicopper oxidase with cupredoxin domain
MNFDCSLVSGNTTCTPNAGVSKFQFQTGKIHRLRLINAGSEGLQRFTIDNHTMTVIAVDFVPVAPYKTNMVTLGVGQRTDVLVKGTGQPGQAYWMRSDFSTLCSFGIILQPHALAAIYYPKANQSLKPNSTATPYTETTCTNVIVTPEMPYLSANRILAFRTNFHRCIGCTHHNPAVQSHDPPIITLHHRNIRT